MIKLSVEKLSKSYSDVQVFNDLSFDFSSGLIGIAGSNGTGKSTLLRTVSGLIQPTSGEVEWNVDGMILNPAQIKPFLGFAAPYVELYEELTARENLRFIRDLRSTHDCEKIPVLFDLFEIETFADSLYGKLSSGQQQRVKLAASVVHKPSILCLDEPGTNLDADGHEIVKKMAQSCTDNGGIVLLASNQPRELELCENSIELGQKSLK